MMMIMLLLYLRARILSHRRHQLPLLSLVQYQCQGDDAGAQNDGGGAEEAQHKELSVGYHVFI